jgi:hypothetical protein
MSADWRAGDKAVCIKVPAGAWLTGQTPQDRGHTFPNGVPIKGDTYTVRGVNAWDGRVCLQLAERPTRGVNDVDEGWAEYLFQKPVTAHEEIRAMREEWA